jgi:hypothetical protein
MWILTVYVLVVVVMELIVAVGLGSNLPVNQFNDIAFAFLSGWSPCFWVGYFNPFWIEIRKIDNASRVRFGS